MEEETPDSMSILEALKSALAEGEGEKYRQLFAEHHEEIMSFNPTQQTYLEAWERIIRVRQDRKSADEALIWESETIHAVDFLTELETHPLPLEEAEKVRVLALGNNDIQTLESHILEGWDSKAALVAELDTKRNSLKAQTARPTSFTPAADASKAAKESLDKEPSTQKKLKPEKPKSST